MSLRLNPQYEKMLPMMSQEEFEQLRESIRTEGQHYPIIVSEDLEVLDGHHRFRACIELGIEPDFEVKHFENKLLEKKFVIEANLRRRHLNNFQLVELAVPLLEIEKALLKKQQTQKKQKESASIIETTDENSFSEFEAKGKTAEMVAKKVGVSTRTLDRGKKIIEKASEEDKQKLREGKTSINKVYHDITPPKTVPKLELNPEVSTDDHIVLRNKKALAEILQSIIEQDLFCPECGSKLFQCSQCHKQLNDIVKDKTQLNQITKLQLQTTKTEPDKQPKENFEDEKSFEANEDFKDEFL
jgi:ParB-like chromosome segregation protein Spo0J/DNA-directed RNA polymerase subunit RPC12/RpoP